MATLQLQINGWDSGWPSGLVTNVDEPVSSADGQVVGTSIDLDTVIFDLDSASAIADIDTVNSITVTARIAGIIVGGATPGDAQMDIALLIGGVVQGTENPGNLSGTMTNFVLTNAGWDSDWTQAQLNGMQIRVIAQTVGDSGTSFDSWTIDTIDVVIDYTVLDPLVALPLVGGISVSGKVPVADLSDLFHLAQPAPANVVLATTVPWADPVATPAAQALALSRENVFPNPLTEQLQINGWDNGWPTGLLTNIDEPSASADGQVISTTGNDSVILDFDDSTEINPLDTIAAIQFVVRARVDVLGGGTLTGATLSLQPRINGIFKTAYPLNIESAEGGFVNFTVDSDTNAGINWDNAWELPDDGLANLNGLQLYLAAIGTCTGGGCLVEFSLDTIDLVVTYGPAGSEVSKPAAASLALGSVAPTTKDSFIEAPLVGAAALSGKSVAIVRDDAAQISARTVMLSGKAPARISNHITLPVAATLSATGSAPVRLRNSIRMSGVAALALSGKSVTLDHQTGGLFIPPVRRLRLFEEAPLSTLSPETREGPGKVRLLVEGKLPVRVETFNHLRDMPLGSLTLTPQLASLDSHTVIPAINALVLSGQVPIASRGVLIPVAQETLLFNGLVPLPATEFTTLTLTGHVPFTSAQATASPVAGSITLAGYAPLALVASIAPTEVALVLTGQVPTVAIETFLVTGLPRIISRTVVREIEFIATPTDLLIG